MHILGARDHGLISVNVRRVGTARIKPRRHHNSLEMHACKVRYVCFGSPSPAGKFLLRGSLCAHN